jgi:hypothetical protein
MSHTIERKKAFAAINKHSHVIELACMQLNSLDRKFQKKIYERVS